LPHGQLLPKRQILEREVAVRAKTASQCPNEDSEPSDHDREITDQSAECKFIAQNDFLEGTTRMRERRRESCSAHTPRKMTGSGMGLAAPGLTATDCA